MAAPAEPRSGPTPPLLVTLALDAASQRHFDRLREAHFPPHRNKLAAHVTLFHHLPGVELADVEAALTRSADRPAFAVEVTAVASLGGGVAFTLSSGELHAVRQELAAAWAPMLTRQDSRPYWPHVTVQNKVSAEAARALLAQLEASFTPWAIGARGLRLWRYLDGPWEPVGEYPFTHRSGAAP